VVKSVKQDKNAKAVRKPQAWNQLPTLIRQMDCIIATFKRHLKTSPMESYCASD